MAEEIVIDNSVIMAWCFEDASYPYADEALRALEHTWAVVPAIWPFEVGNVLVVAERKGRLTMTDGLTFLALLSELPIEIVPPEETDFMENPFLLARNAHLSTYDASYLMLAIKRGIPLTTLDKNMRRAASGLNVKLFKE